jgi:hypothetical protein
MISSLRFIFFIFIILTFTFILANLFKWFKFKCGNRRRESFNPFHISIPFTQAEIFVGMQKTVHNTVKAVFNSSPYTNFHFYHFQNYIKTVEFDFIVNPTSTTIKMKLKYILDNYENFVKLLNIYNRLKQSDILSDEANLFKNLVDIDYEATRMALGIAQITVFEFTNTVTICDKLNFFHNNIITIKDALVFFNSSLNLVMSTNTNTIFEDSILEDLSLEDPVTKCNSFKFLIHNCTNIVNMLNLLKNISNMYLTNSMPCTVGSDYHICPINMIYSIFSRNCMCCGTNVRNTFTHPIDGVYNPSTHCTCDDSLYDWNNDQCIGVCSELLPSRKSRGNKNATSSPGFCQNNRDKDCDPNLCYNNIESPGYTSIGYIGVDDKNDTAEYANLIPLSIQVTNKSDPTEMYCLSKNNVPGNSDTKLNDIGLAECNPSNCSQRFVVFKRNSEPNGDFYTFQYIGCKDDSGVENNKFVKGLLEIENIMDDNWSGVSELHNRYGVNSNKMRFKMNTNNTAHFKGEGGMPHTRKMKNLINTWYTWDKKSDSDNKQGMKSTELEGSEIHFLRR